MTIKFLIILTLLLLISCEKPHGIVVKKEITPKHTDTTLHLTRVGKITIPSRSARLIHEQYKLTIRRIRWQDTTLIDIDVDKELYFKINIGDSL